MREEVIFLVDDDEIVLDAWQEQLRMAGYTVRAALSGTAAVELAKKEKPDIVFADLVMPQMDGVEVCRRIKAIYPDTEIVFISGHPHEIERQLMAFIEAGGRDEYLRKPLFDNELVEVTMRISREREDKR